MKISRRTLLGAAPALALADVPPHRWDGYDFGPGPAVTDRLNQGPFGIDQDEGWFTIAATTPSDLPIRNWGLGLVGYTWEENGPSLRNYRAARRQDLLTALRGRALHPLRLARRPEPPRPPRPASHLEAHAQ